MGQGEYLVLMLGLEGFQRSECLQMKMKATICIHMQWRWKHQPTRYTHINKGRNCIPCFWCLGHSRGTTGDVLKGGTKLDGLQLDEAPPLLVWNLATVTLKRVGLKLSTFMNVCMEPRPKHCAIFLGAGLVILSNFYPTFANQLVLILGVYSCPDALPPPLCICLLGELIVEQWLIVDVHTVFLPWLWLSVSSSLWPFGSSCPSV